MVKMTWIGGPLCGHIVEVQKACNQIISRTDDDGVIIEQRTVVPVWNNGGWKLIYYNFNPGKGKPLSRSGK